jgi:hypothetical protein
MSCGECRTDAAWTEKGDAAWMRHGLKKAMPHECGMDQKKAMPHGRGMVSVWQPTVQVALQPMPWMVGSNPIGS